MAGKVLITDYVWPDLEIERSILGELDLEIVEAPDGEEETLASLAAGCCGILTCWAKTTRKVIEAALPDLRVIVRYGVGLDNIDVAFATEQGIPVANVPDYCFIDVAEHTMALLLAQSHKVAGFDRDVRSGTWSIQSRVPLNRLTERRLGLIGFGQIARQVVPRAKAFGMDVVAFSRSLTDEDAEAVGARCVELDELIESSDFISLHCPLTEETRNLIDSDALNRMKSTAFLINTSRGEVVDEAALADALESGEIAGAALDVRSQEPPDMPDRLIDLPNIIHTPHAAFYSSDSLIELPTKAALEVCRVIRGEELIHLVNPGHIENVK